MIDLKNVELPPIRVLMCAGEVKADLAAGNTWRITEHSVSGKDLAVLSREEAYLALKIALQGNAVQISSSALEIASSLKANSVIGAVSDLIAEQLQGSASDEKITRWLKLCLAWITTWQQVGVPTMPWQKQA